MNFDSSLTVFTASCADSIHSSQYFSQSSVSLMFKAFAQLKEIKTTIRYCQSNCLSTSLAALSIVGHLFNVSLMISLFEFVLNPTSVRGTRVRAFAGTIEVETLGVQ